jgi:endo-1,4-beta-mannosidase
MKTDNLIIFVAGVICAGLLWQYYLYPKYTKKVQEPKTVSDLLEADRVALDKELEKIPGEVLYRSDIQTETVSKDTPIIYQEDPTLEKETITMIKAPVKHTVISNAEDYKKVQDILILDSKEIDFSKEMLILVESNGSLSDGFFQIKDIQNNGEKIIVSYSVNIIGANDRVGKISAQKIKKSDLPITLKQVL